MNRAVSAGLAGGVLERHDVGDGLRQLDQRGGLDLAAGADGDVVEHHRQLGGLGDRAEVPQQPGLGGSVVVRGDDQHAVDPGRLGGLEQLERLAGGVGADTGHHRDRHRLPHHLEQARLLGVGDRRALPGGAGHDQALVALLDQPARQPGGDVEVELAVLVEGGDHRRQHRTESGHRRSPLGHSGRRVQATRPAGTLCPGSAPGDITQPPAPTRWTFAGERPPRGPGARQAYAARAATGGLAGAVDPQRGQEVLVELEPDRVVAGDADAGEPLVLTGADPPQRAVETVAVDGEALQGVAQRGADAPRPASAARRGGRSPRRRRPGPDGR